MRDPLRRLPVRGPVAISPTMPAGVTGWHTLSVCVKEDL